MSTKPEIRIEPELLSSEQVYELFGGNITRSQIEHLMKNKHIKSFWRTGYQRRLMTTRKDALQWLDDISRAKDTTTTTALGADFIVPVAYILQQETGRRLR